MSATAEKETLSFETEVSQLLHLMIHSLYSNKEIFLRELISNCSDACDKLRFEALSDDAIYQGNSDLSVRISFDEKAKTLTIADTGIGMTRDEVIANIGTIAKSGTREFIEGLTGDQSKDSNMIGQFGVGFYSSFIVADKVTLITRRAGLDAAEGVRWESEGKGDYSLEKIDKEERGTEIILHLNDESTEFLNDWKLRSVITKYSDHISFPVIMKKEIPAEKEGEDPSFEDETVNQASALWTRPKKDISDDEYKEFYKHVSHDYDEPLTWSHNRVEGKTEYTSLIYLPKKAPFDLYDRDSRHGMKLYVQRVFIMDDAEELLPRYMRFARGIIDSNDLPLNVSREILQSSQVVDSIRAGTVKKILAMLAKQAKDDKETYQEFWDQFGQVLKEGAAEDTANQEKVAGLLRFASTFDDTEAQTVSFADYVSRMKEGQDKIYYVTADSFSAAKNSPHLEVFRKQGLEVLLFSDRVDEWWISYMTEFDGKSLQSVAKGDLDIDKFIDEDEKKEYEKAEKTSKDIVKRIKEVLQDKVDEVRASPRLTDSPACLVLKDHDMAMYMQRILQQAGQDVAAGKPILEINPTHTLIEKMKDVKDEDTFSDWCNILFDQAMLSEGGTLQDPASFVAKLNKMLISLSK
ncbi:MAG: molecular chaperone HtpG [Gammaproteobacteria bacterium]|nr:molecular chaperone HtpG [Gammaproteobacteria bacterium]